MTTETILIIGGSFAGLSAAHYALRHTIPQLPKKDGTKYTVTLVNPSKDMWWRIGGPREIVNKKLMPSSKTYYPIEPAFAYAKDNFTFVQGTATHVDAAGQNVSVTTASGALFTQTSSAAELEATHEAFQKALSSAKTVVIGGAGPVGVESAGEIGEFLNGKPGFFAGANKNPKAKVTIICADKKMLPILRESISQQAEKLLARLGVNVVYNTKVVSSTPAGDKTTVQLSDGQTMEADIYVDATGGRPNTSFLPKDWLDNRNRVSCNTKTLRVETPSADPRVYVVGDAGSYTRGGVMDMYDAVPVAMTNLKTDLIAHINGTAPGSDRHYTANLKEQQICPIGTQKGVGAFGGRPVPSLMVWAIKGRDYLIGQLAVATMNGDQFKKEKAWKPQPIVASGQAGLSSG
jgi:NADH dehydrogenase FAD-containing subunit